MMPCGTTHGDNLDVGEHRHLLLAGHLGRDGALTHPYLRVRKPAFSAATSMARTSP